MTNSFSVLLVNANQLRADMREAIMIDYLAGLVEVNAGYLRKLLEGGDEE